LTQPALADELRAAAFALVAAQYDAAKIGGRIRTLVDALARSAPRSKLT
jgi:hypothetical protein